MIILYLLESLISAVVIYVIWKLVAFIIKDYKSSLRFIPGPPNASWVFGNLNQIHDAGGESLHEAWVQKYGNVFKYKEWLNGDALYTTDTRALNHILSHSNDYQKPAVARFNLAQVVGKGILFVEGEQHRQQRRIMNPAFGPAQIRELTDIFVEKSIQLRDIWAEEVAKHGEPARIDLINGLSKMTLDVIGLAGFNYSFDALNIDGKTNELSAAFRVVFGSATAKPSVFAMMRYLFPPLRIIPSARIRVISAAMATMRRIGLQLIQEKKAEIAQSLRAGEKANSKLEGVQSRDLLTLLIKANMATDIPESQKLSDEDVLAQVPTFLVAGHETTSNAIAWCLYSLSQAPEVQRKLREELLEVSTDTPTMDELLALQYLDSVVRETLRVHAPVPISGRVAVKDDVIPLNTPFTDMHGQMHDSIKIDKGTHVDIPIMALNRSKELWGDDAFEFKPERWNAIPEATNSIPGVWGNLMTFLGGPRSCIGYRFSLVEMKALVFTLVRAFEFELAVPPEEIGTQATALQRPIVLSEKETGSQLPMLVKPVRRT